MDTFAYQWTKDSGNSTISSSSTLAFSVLKFSNAGKYTCEVNVSSNYFNNGHEIGRDTYDLSIKGKQTVIVSVA